MKMLVLLHAYITHAYYCWAQREVCPQHPDVLKIELKRLEMRDRMRRLLGGSVL